VEVGIDSRAAVGPAPESDKMSHKICRELSRAGQASASASADQPADPN
jgi:hypothetical protein